MKKFGIASLVLGLVLSASAYAADISASGVFVQSLTTTSKSEYNFGKSRIVLNLKADDKVSVTYIGKLDPIYSALEQDYLWADVKTDLGVLSAGVLYDGIGNYGGGINQTNTFLLLTCSQATGVSFSTKFAGYNVMAFNLGSPNAPKATKIYGVKVGNSFGDLSVAGVAKAAVNDDKTGYAAEVEGTYSFGAGKVGAQYFMDLNENATTLMPDFLKTGATKKRAYLGLYGDYNVGYGIGVYGDYVMALNDDTKASWQDNQIKAGGKYALNAKTTLYAEVQSNTEKDKDAEYTSSLGMQVFF